MDRRRFLRIGVAASLATTAGCADFEGPETDTSTPAGGGGGGDGTPTAEPTETDTRTATTGQTEPTETPTAEPAETPAADADQVVAVGPDGSLRFEPATFEIGVGETVRWEWESAGHNVSPESQPDDADWPGDDETTYGAGHAYTYTFEVAGSYEYHCDPHQSAGMTGSFTVQ